MPVEGVIVEVGVVVPVNDEVKPLPPDGLTAAAALVIPPGALADTPDPVTPSDEVMLVETGDVVLVEPGHVVIEELPNPDEAVLLLGLDMLELIGDGRDDVGAVCVNISEIPLLPSIDILARGLHGSDVVLVRPGVWLGGVPEVGFGATCAIAVDAHAILIQMNKGSFITKSPILFRCAIHRRFFASRQPRGYVRLPEQLALLAERV